MIKDYFNIAWKNLKKRKLRAWLTMLGIFISVATIFTLISLSLGLQGAVEEQFQMLGADKFFIQPATGFLGPPGSIGGVILTKEDINIIEKVSGVKKVTYFTFANAKIEFKDETRYFLVIGVPPEGLDFYLETGSLEFEEGGKFGKNDRREIIIGNHYKSKPIFSKPVKAGDKFLINGEEFKVKGILEIIGNPDDDRTIIMPIEDLKEVFGTGDKVDYIMVQINEGENIKEVANNVERKLRNFRNVDEKTQDFTILTPEELLAIFGTILTVITAFLGGVAAISLLVGAIGITNTMYTSVLERTKEIGVMKAIGASNRDVLFIFLIESGLLGLVGGIIGVILGIGAVKSIEYIAFQQLGTKLLQAAIPIWLIVVCLLFAFLIGSISGSLPAWQASKTNVVDALRYE